MTKMHPGKRSARIAAALGTMLATASCANLSGQMLDPQPGLTKRFDGGVGQLVRYCMKLRERGNLAMAAGVCERAHEQDPADPEPLLVLADILLDMGELQQASEAYRVLIAANPEHVEARYRLSKTYIALEQYDLALGELQTALHYDPEDSRLYNAMGIANELLGAHASAQKVFQAGLEIAPDDVSLRNNMGLSLVLSGRHEEGLAMLEEVAADPSAEQTSLDNLQLARGMAVAAKSNEALALADPQDGTALVSEDEDTVDLPAPKVDVAPDGDAGAAMAMEDGDRGETVVADTEVQPVETRTLSAPTLLTGPLLSSRSVGQLARAEATDDGDATPATPGVQSMMGPGAAVEDMHDMPTDPAPGADAPAPMAGLETGHMDAPAGLPETPDGSHVIQFASFRSEDSAWRGWDTIGAEAADLLAGIDPVVQRADLGAEAGVFFRLRTRPAAKADADRLCGDLKSRGIDCLVIRAEPAAADALAHATADATEDLSSEIADDAVNEAAAGMADDASDVMADETSDVMADETADVMADETADVMADETADAMADETSDIMDDETTDMMTDDGTDEPGDDVMENIEDPDGAKL